MQSIAEELAPSYSERDAPPAQADAPDFSRPDCDHITRRVVCPLCEYDLRGLLDARCPECGYRFVWPELLDPKIRRHEFLFEHHPRHNLWSFWKTIRATLLPRRFWRTVYPTQLIRARRLLAYWLLAASVLILSAIGPAIVQLAMEINFILQQRANFVQMINQGQNNWFRSPTAPGQTPQQAIIQRYGSIESYVEGMLPMRWSDRLGNAVYAIRQGAVLQLVVLLWPWATLLSLMIFRVSMRRARIKPVHVLRCVAYSFDAAFWWGCTWLLLSISVGALALLHFNQWYWFEQYALAAQLLWLLFMAFDLIVAYRIYLRFDHPIATVLASQLIVGLLAIVLLLQLYNARYGLTL